jgi:hypothetical protein
VETQTTAKGGDMGKACEQLRQNEGGGWGARFAGRMLFRIAFLGALTAALGETPVGLQQADQDDVRLSPRLETRQHFEVAMANLDQEQGAGGTRRTNALGLPDALIGYWPLNGDRYDYTDSNQDLTLVCHPPLTQYANDQPWGIDSAPADH